MRPRSPALLTLMLCCAAGPVLAGSEPILVDGLFDDWAATVPAATDPSGDGGGSGVDFTSLWVANDENWLYIRFDTGVEVQPDEQQHISFALDTDLNAATGQSIAGIGAELVWNLGQRNGTFYAPGSFGIDHRDIGLVVGATVSDTQFEIAIRRNSVPLGVGPLFPGSATRVAIVDAAGDAIVFDGPGYAFDASPVPVPSIPIGRDDPGHVRIASYNIQQDGLFDGGFREGVLDRIFDAVDADVWVINEVWNHSAAEVAAKVEQFRPSGVGESWSAVKLDQGNVIVSRYAVLDSWLILPGARLTAVLLDLRPDYDTDLLVVANHWSCCTADANRQNQADALTAFLRVARNPGGVITLAQGTPIVAAGDFNLVGWQAQLHTLLTGDIADNTMWGPDSPPDWDGSPFKRTFPRHQDARFAYTWRNDFSSFYPGKLDYIVYTESAADLHNHFVVDTRTMTPASLAAAGLEASDTESGSDHSTVVADFSFGGTASVPFPAGPVQVSMGMSFPNPFGTFSAIQFTLGRDARVELGIYDAGGRLVRSLIDGTRSAGVHRATWDGRDGNGERVAPGLYFYVLDAEGTRVSRRTVRLN